MLEIDVTRLLRSGTPRRFSCSMAEAGPTAGPDSWAAVMASSRARPVVTLDECDDVRDYFRGFGAWDDAEIDAWSLVECSAMALQRAAGDLREAQRGCPGRGRGGVDWAEYERRAESGSMSGAIYVQGTRLFITLSQ